MLMRPVSQVSDVAHGPLVYFTDMPMAGIGTDGTPTLWNGQTAISC